MLTELSSEKFEWFGPSPIEPFNLDPGPLAPRHAGEETMVSWLCLDLECTYGCARACGRARAF